MVSKRDCEACMRMMKEKHKHDKFYRIGFWVVTVLLAVVSTLYFASGDLFKVTENHNNSAEVVIENTGDQNNNNVNINQ